MNKKSNIIAVLVLVGVIVISAGWWTVSASKGSVESSEKVYPKVELSDSGLKGGQGEAVDGGSTSSTSGSGRYVASKNGSKYFPEDCSSSKTIKEANKVYFNTPEEAQKAGYELAKNCKN